MCTSRNPNYLPDELKIELKKMEPPNQKKSKFSEKKSVKNITVKKYKKMC